MFTALSLPAYFKSMCTIQYKTLQQEDMGSRGNIVSAPLNIQQQKSSFLECHILISNCRVILEDVLN